jgi:hypothetical protein
MDQRIGMSMYLPLLRSVMPKDPGHTQRPVLVWQSTDFTLLSFDQDQHGQIAGRVCLHYLQFRFAVLKERARASRRSGEMSKLRVGPPPNGDMSVESSAC